MVAVKEKYAVLFVCLVFFKIDIEDFQRNKEISR